MTTSKTRAPNRRGFYRPLLILALAAGGSLQLIFSALADPTPPNTNISNTATATYTDPTNPTQTITTTSNTVTVIVAEVAGITATPLTPVDVNGGSFLPNDVVDYLFEVTNRGNDPTKFFIPTNATISGAGTQGTILISLDNGATYVPVTGNLTPSIAAGGKIIVKVPVTININVATNDVIKVTLGKTGSDDNSQGTQNVDETLDGTNADEVRTVDNADGTNSDTTGVPANKEREASAFREITIGAQLQSFAAVLKERTGYSNSGTAALNDDLLTYKLALRVDNARPVGSSGALAPAPLAGTPISINTISVSRVLVSDAIPTQTVLTGTPTAPPGWTVVYTNSLIGTIANDAKWVTDPVDIGGIANATRIGFINNGPIPTNTTVDNFIFQVRTTGVTTTTTIANIAQVFGTSAGGGTAIVYDESGDSTPTNYNDSGTPGSTTPTTGKANPTTDGIDTGNTNGGDTNNSGLNGGGEDNVYTLTEPGTILNGPNGQPGATGPTGGINDDFTNKSSNVPVGQAPGTTFDPGSVTYTNTISSPTALTNVSLVPSDLTGTNTVPTFTTVTITFGGNSATYTYNGTDFVLNAGNTVVIVPTVTPGTPVSYTVVVDLPIGTPLSTDLGTPRDDYPSYPVPIYAFQDANGDGSPQPTTEVNNATIDRLYTGFLRLFKEARVLDATGTEVQAFSTAPLTANIRPGNIIEYRITYTNISTPQGSGANNQILSAANVVITEDGIAGSNNWAEDQNTDSTIDTSNVPGTTTKTNGTVTFAPGGDVQGTTAATDVTQYQNDLGATSIPPNGTGTFTFQRKVN